MRIKPAIILQNGIFRIIGKILAVKHWHRCIKLWRSQSYTISRIDYVRASLKLKEHAMNRFCSFIVHVGTI
jgi:hypothetical protein